jgi:catechol 2,3-dioxygenase-like lactoylglutathione lyase family enzyme
VLASFDHAVIAVRDLDAASAGYAALLGRAPSWRGHHPGAGTANSLFRLANGYVELLAQAGAGPIGDGLRAAIESRGEGLVGLAFGTPDAARCASAWREVGIAATGPDPGEGRDAGSGAVRRWRTATLPLQASRGVLLFAIEHTAGELPQTHVDPAGISALDHVVVTSTDLEASRAIYADLLGLRLALDRRFEARRIRILFFRIAGVTVEVAGALGPADPAEAGDRFGGLAYRVDDVGATRERVAAAGFDVSSVRDGAKPGTRVCTVRDGTHGVPTLLIEPASAPTAATRARA